MPPCKLLRWQHCPGKRTFSPRPALAPPRRPPHALRRSRRCAHGSRGCLQAAKPAPRRAATSAGKLRATPGTAREAAPPRSSGPCKVSPFAAPDERKTRRRWRAGRRSCNPGFAAAASASPSTANWSRCAIAAHFLPLAAGASPGAAGPWGRTTFRARSCPGSSSAPSTQPSTPTSSPHCARTAPFATPLPPIAPRIPR